jgi:hypothetical protein
MNYGRLAVAAVAAFVTDAVFGFVVYGSAMASQFAMFPGVYRPPSDTSHLWALFVGLFIGAVAATYIYAKGYEGGSGASEGLRFGAAVGVFMAGYSALVSWAVLNITRALAYRLVAAALVEWLIVGLVIGLVYKSSSMPRRAVTV